MKRSDNRNPVKPMYCKTFILRLTILAIAGLIFQSNLTAQEYSLKILGFTIGNATMDLRGDNDSIIEFTTGSQGLMDVVFPFNNSYTTAFDPASFGFRDYEKKIVQGGFEQKLHGNWDPQTKIINYGSKTMPRENECHNIFSLLARMQAQPRDSLDTHWFDMEHEGQFFRARLLWNDSTDIEIHQKIIPCDHYRLDLQVVNGDTDSEGLLEVTDYFSKYIIHPNAVRQIWVSKVFPNNIIKTSVKLYGITIEALILL
jgi:hypothetical protein